MAIEFLRSPRVEGDEGARAGPVVVPAEAYLSPERFARELHRVLARNWIVAGHSSALAEEGSFLVWDGFGQSVVVTRGRELRAFHNVCQHRGVRLVDVSGRCDGKELVCPWHGFSYDLSGRVAGVPRRATFDPELLADLAAPAVGVAEFAGFIWINLAGTEVEELRPWLGPLDEELGGYEMGEWYVVGERHLVIQANWKAAVEGFSEDYHASLVHDATIPSGLDYQGTQISLFDRHSMMVTPLSSIDYSCLTTPIDHRSHAYSHYSAFPTTVFSCFPTHVQVMSFIPRDVDSTDLRVWVVANPLAPPGIDQERYERRMSTGVDHFAAIAQEDVAVIDRLSLTRRSLGYRENLYGSLEARISLFHRVLDRELGPPTGERP